MTTIIIALWRHRLNLSGFTKPDSVRLIAVGPPNSLINETCFDAFYQVEGPISIGDHNHSKLCQKVRELASNSGATNRRICVFEKELQRDIAEIRFQLDIDGISPELLDQILHLKDLRLITRRSGLTTLRHCSFVTAQRQPDSWVEWMQSQLGGFPIFIKPVVLENTCMHTRSIIRNEDELRQWIKARSGNFNQCTEYLIEECFENGYEFTAICSKTGLLGTVASISTQYTIYESIRNQIPYALECLTAEQTRDVFPGIESFVLQCMKTIFNRSIATIIFIKGFYQGHNSIYFLGASLEPKSTTFCRLVYQATNSFNWEVMLLHNMLRVLEISESNSDSSTTDASQFNAVINFPTSEGILLHQTSIRKRRANIRVTWRVSEGEEISDSDSLDDNIVQVFLSHSNRNELLEDVDDIINKTDITVDRLSVIDRHNVCRRAQHHTNGRNTAVQLVRSCTTVD